MDPARVASRGERTEVALRAGVHRSTALVAAFITLLLPSTLAAQPGVEAPRRAPAPDAHALEAPAPDADAPNADAPNAAAPNADAPNADAPSAHAPSADAPSVHAPNIAALDGGAPPADAGPAIRAEVTRREGDALDVWSEPNPGVRYLRRTVADPALSLHALVVDLSHPGVSVVTTAEDERWDSVSGFARRRGAVAAINGGFWTMLQTPCGVTAGAGEPWSNSTTDPDFGHLAIQADGRAFVRGPGQSEDVRSLARLEGAVSGRPVLVERGEPTTEQLDSFPSANLKQPRTAVGVSRDGRTLILVVVDGRQGHSRGLTLYQLARVLIELGADRAINLDGGGSSAMYVAEAGGVVGSPAAGRWARAVGLAPDETRRVRRRGRVREAYVRGVEREVLNHVAILAPAPAVAVEASQSALADGLGDLEPRDSTQGGEPLFVPARRSMFRVGRVREVLYPAAMFGVPIAVALALLWLARRLYRRWTRNRSPTGAASAAS